LMFLSVKALLPTPNITLLSLKVNYWLSIQPSK
jgi:hypothetical protein